jgi:fatty acid desaturase
MMDNQSQKLQNKMEEFSQASQQINDVYAIVKNSQNAAKCTLIAESNLARQFIENPITTSENLKFNTNVCQRKLSVQESIEPEKQNWLKNRLILDACVLIYTIGGFFISLYLILVDQVWANLLGMTLMIHTSIWATLLTHEFMHDTIFKKPKINYIFGVLMTIISGGCYFSYKLLKHQHIEHHRNKVGYDRFSVTTWLLSLPAVLKVAFVTLEFCYVPVLSFVSRWRNLLLPMINPQYKNLRLRIIVVFILQSTFFTTIYLIHSWSILYALLAHIVMLNVLRVYDCYHHTFAIIPLGSSIPKLEKDYEQKNTYSSLISRKHYWLNWIFLNYGYHNAHHYKPHAHWYELPRIDADLYQESEIHCILFPDLVLWYHRNRIKRIYNGLGAPNVQEGKLKIDKFWGVIMNISFIVYDM